MNSRRKELLEQFKQMKPDMGIFMIRSQTSHKCFLETSHNLRGRINSTLFKLNGGVHPNRELQKEWREQGADNFSIEILETLKYDEDESKTDYREELTILQMVWEDRLSGENALFYSKNI